VGIKTFSDVSVNQVKEVVAKIGINACPVSRCIWAQGHPENKKAKVGIETCLDASVYQPSRRRK
jgi:hypothetical protein